VADVLKRSQEQSLLIVDAKAIAPLFVVTHEEHVLPSLSSNASDDPFVSDLTTRRIYFWFFGHVAELPYEQDVSGKQAIEAPRLKLRRCLLAFC
jgi:hypothetical protein